MLGYYASNIMEDLVDIIQWNKVDELDKNNSIIVDVREEFELVTGTFENSINIPLGQLRDRLDEIPKNKNVYVTCQVGQRGYVASRILRSNGINAINIDGGIKTYIYVKRSQESIKNQFDNKNEAIALSKSPLNTTRVAPFLFDSSIGVVFSFLLIPF